MRIAYLVHDLSNPTVGQRVEMLRAGGAEVVLVGFNRGREPVNAVAGFEAVDLGPTSDAQLVRRVWSVLRALSGAPFWGRCVRGADVILARNLEMLLLASVARVLAAPRAALVYEVLDVHRMMLGEGLRGRLLRGLEGRLMRRASSLVVSSPAFLSGYFEPRGQPRTPVVLVENKAPGLDGPAARPPPRPPGPPWRIGWCGMIRCQRSLDILTDLARRAPGLVEIEIHGRPAYTEFRDFDAQVASVPGVRYRGPYAPAALPEIYGRMHFVWAVDYFEDGMNSDWLLPCRLYEGQLNGAVAIALRGVETGRWLVRHRVGVLLESAEADLAPAMSALTSDAYAELAARTAALPLGELVFDRSDCEALIHALAAPVGA